MTYFFAVFPLFNERSTDRAGTGSFSHGVTCEMWDEAAGCVWRKNTVLQSDWLNQNICSFCSLRFCVWHTDTSSFFYSVAPFSCLREKVHWQKSEMFLARSALSLSVWDWLRRDCLKAQKCNLGRKCMQNSRQPSTRCFFFIILFLTSICKATSQQFLPQFVLSGLPLPAELNPINILHLINKWNNLFSYFWVAH